MSGPVDRLKAKYPGIEVISDVQAHALLEEFTEGAELFRRLNNQSADDFRWVGVCFFSLFKDREAISAYEEAIRRGSQAARINLAHSLAFVDRPEEVLAHLEQVSFDRLSVYDRVLYLRVKSLHDERNGQLHVALQQAEHAWRIVQGAPEFPLLAPKLLNQLGILHGRIGRAQRALWYLDRNLEISVGDEKTRVHITRVRVLNSLGLIREARDESRHLSSAPAHYGALIKLRNAEISWAEGSIQRAMSEYEEALRLAREFEQAFEEFQASLDTVVLRARFRGESAGDLLHSAQRLISDRSDRLLFRFREILLYLWQGRYTRVHAAAELTFISASFGEMGLLQEQGWVNAHRAHALYLTGDEARSSEILDSLAALAVTLQNPAFLIREWQLMQDFGRHVQTTHPMLTTSDARRESEGSRSPGAAPP